MGGKQYVVVVRRKSETAGFMPAVLDNFAQQR